MCLHAAFDLLFVGLSTGIVTSIDLVVSHTGIRAWANMHVCKYARGRVDMWITLYRLSSGSQFLC